MLEGKVAIITGSGGGIGRAVALAMADAGARVVINDIGVSVDGTGEFNSHAAEETRDLVVQRGGTAVVSVESVAAWDSAQRIVERAMDEFGRVDIVVNNAGIMRDSSFEVIEPTDWQTVIDVNLTGSFLVARAAAPLFKAQGSGAYVHFTSTGGLIGNFNRAAYAAAKMGLVALSKCIALDMGRHGVRSNCIAPFAWSRMTSGLFAHNAKGPAGAPLEQLRAMTPEKNAPLAVFLASDAAKDVNGQIFGVRKDELFVFSQHRPVRGAHRDGGWTPQAIARHALPALRSGFSPLDTTNDVFDWAPI